MDNKDKINEAMQKSLEYIRSLPDTTRMIAEQDPRVKAGERTVDQMVSDDPNYVLYHRIMEAAVRVFEDSRVVQCMGMVAEDTTANTSTNIMTVMATAIPMIVWSSLLTYDTMMTDALNRMFSEVTGGIQKQHAELQGVMGAMKIFRRDLEELKQEKVKAEINPNG